MRYFSSVIVIVLAVVGTVSPAENWRAGLQNFPRPNVLFEQAGEKLRDANHIGENIEKHGPEDLRIAFLDRGFKDSLYGLIAEARDGLGAGAGVNVSALCWNHTLAVIDGLVRREMWAIKMLDATGRVESGVLQGNLLWLGSYSECLNVTAEVMTTPTNKSVHLFDGQYCLTSLGNLTGGQGELVLGFNYIIALQLGLCIPSSCSDDDVKQLTDYALSPVTTAYGAIDVNCHKSEGYSLDAAAIGMIFLLSVIGFFLLVATLYDIFIHQRALAEEQSKPDPSTSNGEVQPNLRVEDYTPLVTERTPLLHREENDVQIVGQHPKKSTRGSTSMTLLQRVLVNTSMYSNGKKLLSTEQGKDSLSCIHGIRFLSMTWVILGHTFVFGFSLFRNPLPVYELFKQFAYQTVINGSVSVDTFFVISGLLVGYLYMKDMKNKGGPRKVNWFMYYFHRFWRLTPPYMIIIGIYAALYRYFTEGPFWKSDVPDPFCTQNWWANMLYVNNIVRPMNMCLGWSWYLANDMQFYWISPLILIPLFKSFRIGVFLITALTVTSTVITALITGLNHYPAEIGNAALDIKVLVDWFNDVYITPWCRIGPYLIGMLVGYILYRTDRKVNLHWVVVVLGWSLAAACNLTVLYGLYDSARGAHVMTDLENAVYASLHRTAWAMGVSWVIFACVTGYGGFVNTILSWSALVPLSRLTYIAYLIHPMVMMWYYLSREVGIIGNDINMTYLFFGHLMTSYGIAFIASLAFEAPMMGLERALWRKKS